MIFREVGSTCLDPGSSKKYLDELGEVKKTFLLIEAGRGFCSGISDSFNFLTMLIISSNHGIMGYLLHFLIKS